jgi:pyrimidine-specific ribonucleoside hydrolase
MRRFSLRLLVSFLAIAAVVRAHEEITPVIVDTDMALDDARAVTLLATSPRIELKAVVTSDGSASPPAGARNLHRLLQFLNHDRVPIGIGRELDAVPPPWRERAEALGWAELSPAPANPLPPAGAVIEQVLAATTEPVTYVCLGPLTNLADVLRRAPALRDRLSVVWFYGAPPTTTPAGWNVDRDPASATFVFASGIPIVAATLPEAQTLRIDDALLAQLMQTNTPAARLIERLHRDARVREHLRDPHVRAWDDTIALLLLAPSLGQLSAPTGHVQRVIAFDAARAVEIYREALAGGYVPATDRPLVVLRAFPSAPGQLQDDVAPFASQIIARHGDEEWKIVVLTNELHRHLGFYSILGAKMGLRARELLGAGLDELRVESLAGLQPPVSCLNDGLQVSTGASLGRGAICVPATTTPQAAATFTAHGRRVRLQVKANLVDQIEAEIRTALRQHGGLTPAYFAAVRRISLEAWRDLDRKVIFEETFAPVPERQD